MCQNQTGIYPILPAAVRSKYNVITWIVINMPELGEYQPNIDVPWCAWTRPM